MNCIAARCLINIVCLYQVMMTLHFLNDVVNDAESTQKKSEKFVIITSLKRETIGRVKNIIPGSCLLISRLYLPIYKGYLPVYFKGYGIIGTPYTSLIMVILLLFKACEVSSRKGKQTMITIS